jgi:hypothetical protein
MRRTDSNTTGPHGPAVPSAAPVDHEHSDINVRGVFAFVVVLLVVAVVVHVAMWLLFEWFEAREAATDPAPQPLAAEACQIPPEPRLQSLQWPKYGWSTPTQDLRVFRRTEDQVLHGYDWIDQGKGLVRIPIDRAMELIAAREARAAEAPAAGPSRSGAGARRADAPKESSAPNPREKPPHE